MLKQRTLIFSLVILMIAMAPTAVRADETALFTNVAPDAVFMLDLSGSMSWNPAGDTKAYGNTACSTSTPFALSSSVTTPMDCKRLSIAKRAMFNILDDNIDGKINCYDGPSLNIRMGYMGFRNTETVQSYYNKVTKEIGRPYQDIYCSASTACGTSSMYYCQVGGGGTPPNLSMESAGGSTPLNFALNEIKTYLNTNKAADASRSCRQKFVILISDGADTLSCGGLGTETAVDMYKRRRLSVTRVKALADAGYKVFVIGFGANMPVYLQNTLNWMAYYGGTDNPLAENSGDTDAYDPTLNAECAAVAVENTSGDLTGSCLGTSTDCYAKVNDPGNTPLSGYAFLTSNSTELVAALKQAMEFIRESTYSFSTASVASARTQDEDYIYEASFQPSQ